MTAWRYAFAFVLIGPILFCAVSAGAQDPEAEVSDGVPAHPVEASQAVLAVEKAVRQVEEKVAEGLPADYTIEFGDTYDWIRLPSGEWLKGDLNWMRDEDIEFDSDELDFLNKSWSDVHVLHSPNGTRSTAGSQQEYSPRRSIPGCT